MLRINSVNAIKTCYIADVKEQLGLITRTAANRQGNRKIKAPKEYVELIKQAIYQLNKNNEKATYINIQKKAFEIYQQEKKHNTLFKKYFGAIKTNLNPKELQKIIDDEDLSYED